MVLRTSLLGHKKILLLFAIGVFIMGYLYNRFYLLQRINDIKNDILITNGVVVIVRIGHMARGPKQCQIIYEYQVHGRKYEGKKSWSIQDRNLGRGDLIYKQFPVAYSSKHYEVSDILINYEDSAKYDLIQ